MCLAPLREPEQTPYTVVDQLGVGVRNRPDSALPRIGVLVLLPGIREPYSVPPRQAGLERVPLRHTRTAFRVIQGSLLTQQKRPYRLRRLVELLALVAHDSKPVTQESTKDERDNRDDECGHGSEHTSRP